MRVLLTGASGFIGSAIIPELRASKHRIVGLARSDEAAAAIRAAGADEVLRGDLKELDSLRRAVASVDGVIHCAFVHDWVHHTYQETCAIDCEAVTAMAAAMAHSNKPLVVTSGTGLLASLGRLATEDDEWLPSPMAGRGLAEKAIQAAASNGVRACIVRLPPTVHGDGDKGFMVQAIRTARDKSVSCYVADGSNAWPAVHRLDAARLFVLALEKGEAGAAYHAVGDEAVPFKQIAEAIAARLDVPTDSLPQQEAMAHFGFLGMVAGLHNPSSSRLTQQRLAWSPSQPSLLADLQHSKHYFAADAKSKH